MDTIKYIKEAFKTPVNKDATIDLGTVEKGTVLTPEGINAMALKKLVEQQQEIARLKRETPNKYTEIAMKHLMRENNALRERIAVLEANRSGPPAFTDAQWKRISNFG